MPSNAIQEKLWRISSQLMLLRLILKICISFANWEKDRWAKYFWYKTKKHKKDML